MHRDTVTGVAITKYVLALIPLDASYRAVNPAFGLDCSLASFYRTNFVITSSADGHLKFWKKQPTGGIEFVKHYRTHLSPIVNLSVSEDGLSLASLGADQGGKTVEGLEVKGSAKVFDVENFGEWSSRLRGGERVFEMVRRD